MKQCENCGIEHDGTYGSGRFCSTKCSRGFSTKAKRKEINKKVSKSLIKESYFRLCPECKTSFETKRKSKIFCGLSCSAISGNRKSKKIRSAKAKQRIKNNPEESIRLSILAKNTNSKRIYTPLSEDTKRKISLNNMGGHCEWYEFIKNDGTIVKVQGTYELRFANILNKIDENWIKPTIHNRKHQFNWIGEDGKSHWYTPDFWSPKLNKYFEIKGFWRKDDIIKKKFIETLSNIEIIYKEDIIKMEKT